MHLCSLLGSWPTTCRAGSDSRAYSAPTRHSAERRRLRTVLQELMYLAARLIDTGRRLKLAFGRSCRVVPVYRRLYFGNDGLWLRLARGCDGDFQLLPRLRANLTLSEASF